jgi:hypothetical protein
MAERRFERIAVAQLSPGLLYEAGVLPAYRLDEVRMKTIALLNRGAVILLLKLAEYVLRRCSVCGLLLMLASRLLYRGTLVFAP